MAETAIIDFNNPANGMKVNSDGSINTSGGAITNDGTFAKESGGHLAAIDTATAASKTDLDSLVTNTTGLATQTTLASVKTDLDTIATNTTGIATAANQSTANTSLSSVATNTSNTATVAGATGDAAVTGDNPGTTSAKLRGLNKILNSVWDSVNSWLQVKVMNATPSGQQLSQNSTSIVPASDSPAFPFNLTKINGSAPSSSNGLPTLATIQQFILDGKAFSCSTGKVSAAANQAASWFSANTSAKSKLLYSVRVSYSNATQSLQFTYLTADDSNITGGTSDIANAVNLKYGGAAPEAATVMHHASAVASAAGTLLQFEDTPTNNIMELIIPGTFLYIPAGAAGGVGLYQATTAAGSWTVSVKWVEF